MSGPAARLSVAACAALLLAPAFPAAAAPTPRAWSLDVSRRIRTTLRTPPSVSRGERDACAAVSFTADAGGHIAAIRLVQPSDAPDWDQAVLRAVAAADPLPAPPPPIAAGGPQQFRQAFRFDPGTGSPTPPECR